MIIRETQIFRDWHGKCGLIPNPTLPSNKVQLPPSGPFTKTLISLFDFVVGHLHFKQGGTAHVRL